jgi:hypothetical protein
MIDRDIRDALNVDPSPEFLARVRTRIANEPAPSAWRWSWTVAAAGAMAASVIAAVILMPVRETMIVAPGATRQETPVAQAFKPAEAAAAARKPSTAGPPPRAISRYASDATVRLKPDTTELPLLFDQSEMRALQGLIAAARNGSVALTTHNAAAPPEPMELEPVTDIVIAPITIEPLAPPSGAEGARQ